MSGAPDSKGLSRRTDRARLRGAILGPTTRTHSPYDQTPGGFATHQEQIARASAVIKERLSLVDRIVQADSGGDRFRRWRDATVTALNEVGATPVAEQIDAISLDEYYADEPLPPPHAVAGEQARDLLTRALEDLSVDPDSILPIAANAPPTVTREGAFFAGEQRWDPATLTDDELLDRIRAGEGPLCEFKASAQSDEIRKAVVAFANTVRGSDVAVLFLGINGDGTPSGITDADKTQREVRRQLDRCYPAIPGVQIRPIRLAGQDVVCVLVPESKAAPHFTGAAFVRVGSESIQASAEQFAELIADRTEASRLLRPWVNKDIRIEMEVNHHRSGRIWPGSISTMRLLSIDALGLSLFRSGATPITATWDRVGLQPMALGQPPLIRIALD